MFRSRGENLRSVFVLLFLNVAFFLLEFQDPEKYARLFAFDRDAVAAGQVWRVVTFQFTQPGAGFMQALSLFVTLLLLYIMGSALEEEWGTLHFVTLFLISTAGSAGLGALLGIQLLGTYFVYFTLLFVYAAAFPHQTFYFFGLIPVRVRLLAVISLGVLIYGVFSGGMANLAALGGAVAASLYYLSQRVRAVRTATSAPAQVPQVRIDSTAINNASRYEAIKRALASGSSGEIDALIANLETIRVAGVNVCPPPDYKPGNADGYCIRCEGFAECSARYLRMNRPSQSSAALGMPRPDAS